MNDHDSRMAAENIRMIYAKIAQAATMPSVLFRPALRKWVWPDGRLYWTATYGDVTGQGPRPKDAMTEFDLAWQRYDQPTRDKDVGND